MAENEALLEKVRLGDKNARDEVITQNLPFVNYILHKRFNFRNNVEDYFECGVLGLIKAVDAYKPSKGVLFSTFASRCIENEILMQVRRDKNHNRTGSLDELLFQSNDDSSKMSLLDTVQSPNNEFIEIEKKDEIKSIKILAACKLTKKQAKVINDRYFTQQNVKQKEISKETGLCQSYISRLEKKAIATLKKEIKKIEND